VTPSQIKDHLASIVCEFGAGKTIPGGAESTSRSPFEPPSSRLSSRRRRAATVATRSIALRREISLLNVFSLLNTLRGFSVYPNGMPSALAMIDFPIDRGMRQQVGRK
jgi:hypothetical protein